jgi:antitoxin (DNA-binding transcriptional repressor) of toxin-antitoxin stability system
MPSTTIEIHELPGRWSEVLSQAAEGTEIIVTEGDVPRAKLVPLPTPTEGARVPGLHPGAFVMADDFDAPLSEDEWVDAS